MNKIAPSRLVIDLNAFAHNVDAIQRKIGPETGIMAVVKASAYGHGLLHLARKALQCGVKMLCVATAEEGLRLRQAGIEAPILVMVQQHAQALPAMVENRLTPMISDLATGEALGAVARKLRRVTPVHCKIDTGMGRQGFSLETALEDIQSLTRISNIDVEGIATHFPTAYIGDDSFTYGQIKAFKHLLKQLDKAGIPYESVHCTNSPAIFNYPQSYFDHVRVGLALYGIWPTDTPPQQEVLKPVMRWETRIIQVRELPGGVSIGYGRTYTTTGSCRIALLPVGYGDGYLHALSNRADVLIQGQRCPVRGSVNMDQIVADVSHLDNVQVGMPAVILGADGNERVTAEELAVRADTIPYEVVTRIGPRVPREYIE